MYPRLVTDLSRLKRNIDRMAALCHERGLTSALVTKCVCADSRVVELMSESECDLIADSRIQNLAGMETKKPRYLLRIGQPWEAEGIIRHSEISQESETETIRLLGAEARKQNKPHKIVIMIDMGDLREGVFYKNEGDVLALAKAVMAEEMLELYGVGVNLTCFGGILPDKANLSALVKIAGTLRRETGMPIPFVSGGNSSSLPMLLAGELPEGITNLRIGEGYLLGRETVDGTLMEGFEPDCFTIEAQLIEVKKKPSKPIGKSGMNAFGEYVSFEDRGEMLRGICALGRQDTEIGGLSPLDSAIEILGASSDHLILNLTEAGGRYAVGDTVRFSVDYGALLHASTSGYIYKTYK